MALAVVPGYLFLIPRLQWPPQQESVCLDLKAPLLQVLRQISLETRKTSVGAKLDVALYVPGLSQSETCSGSALYSAVQLIVSRIYNLICVIAAEERIDIEDSEGIDVRLLLLSGQRGNTDEQDCVGPVVTVQTLARSGRKWQELYSVEGGEGEELLRQFLINQDNRVKVQKLRTNPIQTARIGTITASKDSHLNSLNHDSIAVGGTWDHIHVGHKLLLTMFAFLLYTNHAGLTSQQVLTIGITGDELLKNKKHPELLESWQDRQRSVYQFLKALMDFRAPGVSKVETLESSKPGPNGHTIRYKIGDRLSINAVEISDPFGPTITDRGITALVLSAETRAGGRAVNDKRRQQGWPELEVFEVDVLDAHDIEGKGSSGGDAFASKLSSTSIRQSILEKARTRSKA